MSEESTKPPEEGFCVRSDSRNNEGCGVPQKGGGSVQEDGLLLYRCQSLTCGRKDQARRHVDLVPFVFPSEDGFGCTRDVCTDQRWRKINSEHEDGADAKALKRRGGDSAVWDLLDRASNVSDNKTCGRARTCSGMCQEKQKDEEPSLAHMFVSIVSCSLWKTSGGGCPQTMEIGEKKGQYKLLVVWSVRATT